jgi:methionyl-tRNA formyltransferase
MKIVFMGATKFSEAILLDLISKHFKMEAIFTIPQKFHISYSKDRLKNYNYVGLRPIAEKYKIRFYEVDAVPGKGIGDYYPTLQEIEPDLILVMGWYYMVPKRIRELAKYGAWGIHASLLPKYAGGAPLVWAIINGEKETGITLFKLGDGVDDGDIIDQKSFPIELEDTIKEVYEKAIEASKGVLAKALSQIKGIKPRPQSRSHIKIYPQRRPEDGEIDLKKTALEIYNFVRAQSSPYPGAFIKTVDGKRLVIEKARIEDPIEYMGEVYG